MSAETLPPILRRIRAAQTAISMIAAAVIILSTVADVALRYGFGHPISGAYDIVGAMLVLFVFHGLAAVFVDRAHIVIDLVDHLSGPRGRRALTAFGDLAGVAALLLIAWAMVSPALQAFDYGDRMLELGLPVWVVWVFAGTGMAGAIVCAVGITIVGLRRRPHFVTTA